MRKSRLEEAQGHRLGAVVSLRKVSVRTWCDGSKVMAAESTRSVGTGTPWVTRSVTLISSVHMMTERPWGRLLQGP